MELTVPVGEYSRVAEILASTHGIEFRDDGGWVLRKFTVTGPQQALDALRPKLQEWEHDYVSREAW